MSTAEVLITTHTAALHLSQRGAARLVWVISS